MLLQYSPRVSKETFSRPPDAVPICILEKRLLI